MIDETETLIPVQKVAHLVNPAKPPNLSTVWRWITAGVHGVRLEAVRLGGCRFSSREAVQRFVRALNEEPGTVPAPPTAAAERAGRELAAKRGGKRNGRKLAAASA